jgi:hypothetical protein
METLNKFILLPNFEKKLLIKAIFLILLVRFVTFILPFGITKIFLLKSKAVKHGHILNPPSQDKIRWAVDAITNKIPFTKNCLVKSIVIHILFLNSGYESKINFGIMKNNNEKLNAHAWIESEGKIFSSEEGLYNYTLMQP